MKQTARLADDGCTIIVTTEVGGGVVTATYGYPDKAAASAGFRKALDDARTSAQRYETTQNTLSYRKHPTQSGSFFALRQDGPPRWLLPRVRLWLKPSRVEVFAGWLETGYAVGWVRRA